MSPPTHLYLILGSPFTLRHHSGNSTIWLLGSPELDSKFLIFLLFLSPSLSVLLSGGFKYISYISIDFSISAIKCLTTNSIFFYLFFFYNILKTFYGSDIKSHISEDINGSAPHPHPHLELIVSASSNRFTFYELVSFYIMDFRLVILCCLFLKFKVEAPKQ